MPEQLQANFFVIRSPRLSLDVLRKLAQAPGLMHDEILKLLAEPEVQEAIYLATPEFFYRLQKWKGSTDPKDKTLQTVLKYMIRMTSRATPFGLFSGVSMGTPGDRTLLTPAHPTRDRRKTRLDMSYLMSIRQNLPSIVPTLTAIKWRLNQTVLDLGNSYHYIEAIHNETLRQYKLSLAEQDVYLKTIVRLAIKPSTMTDLLQSLTDQFPELDHQLFQNYLHELIAAQILLPYLPLPLTCGQPDQTFAKVVAEAGAHQLSTDLNQVLSELRNIDLQSNGHPSKYQAMFQRLSLQPVPIKENRLFQTDLWRTMHNCTLAPSVFRELEAVLLTLSKLNSPKSSPFTSFIRKFRHKFDEKAVPLLKALDEEIGISFSDEVGYDAELLRDLSLTGHQTQRVSTERSSFMALLTEQLLQQNKSSEIHLKSAVLLNESDKSNVLRQLPSAFSSLISLYNDEKGDTLIHLHGSDGPSGANWLGRFCHLDPELAEFVRDYLRQEAAMSPEVILAEVVHLPDGRPGNVIARPALRQYEIVLLSDSVLPAEQQIQLDELMVFIDEDEVKLWCPRLNSQVIPRLSAAHNFSERSLGLYRFLCMLQHQYGQVPVLQLPKSWQMQERQPRIQIDRIIVSEAHWRVERKQLELLRQSGQDWELAWQTLCNRYQLDRFVCYASGDHTLTLDLHQQAMLELLLSETTTQSHIVLKEALAMKYQSQVCNQHRGFAHELLIPWLNPGSIPNQSSRIPCVSDLETEQERLLFPGSSWLHLKLYAAAGTAELLLWQLLGPCIDKLMQKKLVKQWFFIRYGDPDWHIRLRLHGDSNTLLTTVMPMISSSLSPWIARQRVWRMEIVPYERELERYGGLAALQAAELIFMVDSQFTLSVLSLIQQSGEPTRALMALAAIDIYLSCFGYCNDQKLKFVSELRQSYGDEFREDRQLRVRLGRKFRTMRTNILRIFQLINQENTTSLQVKMDESTASMIKVALEFRQQLLPLIKKYRHLLTMQRFTGEDAAVAALLHMSCNRLFKNCGREQEFVCFDLLRRIYMGNSCQQLQENENSE